MEALFAEAERGADLGGEPFREPSPAAGLEMVEDPADAVGDFAGPAEVDGMVSRDAS